MQQGGNRAFIVSHTKHHHHNYHDHNRKDGNDDNRHYHYYHHHPEALVQTMLIGPLGCESRFLEWVNWKYFSNIGERADNIIHNHNWSLSYYVPSSTNSFTPFWSHPQLHDQEHHHHQWEEGVDHVGGGSKCYTPTPEVTIFVTILLLCILSFRQTLLYIS